VIFLSVADCCGHSVAKRRSVLRLMRPQELFFRWCELAAFTPVFRTHPGSYPDLNWQVIDFGKRRVYIFLFSPVLLPFPV
jgi:alpha-glucosidase (family GH31 glycosyl hydrolase)